MGGKREGFSGTCTKDIWTKPKGVRIEGKRRGCGEGKWKQLYLNNNINCEKRKNSQTKNK